VAALLARRSFLLGATAAVACSHEERTARGSGPGRPTSNQVQLLEWDLGAQAWGPARAAVLVPKWGAPGQRFPVVVALHGRGEAVRGPVDGALGWPRDYALMRAFDRVRAPPLAAPDYEGLVEPSRLAETNALLARQPFAGVIVACPYLPDVRPAATGDVAAYARFVLDVLLPRVRSETPALASAAATGIDGVSLGGVVALRIGLTCPEAFGAVGGIQPAIGEGQTAEWTALALAARARRPDLKLRLVTSLDDYFRDAIYGVSRGWDAAGIAHDFADLPGPHDYVFNRGPGSIDLLLWHDRALAHGLSVDGAITVQ
jgi:enterochelin esterase-like enzyme